MPKGRPKRFRVRKDVRLPHFSSIYNKGKKAIKADTGIAELSWNAEGAAEKILNKKSRAAFVFS